MSLDPRTFGMITPSTPTVVEASRIRELCDVVNDPNPIFTESWRGGRPLAPPTFINCFRDLKSQLLIDELGVDMPKLLHGEQIMTYHKPVLAGDVVFQDVAIVAVEKKSTKAMGTADFFKVRIRLMSPEGEPLTEALQSFFVRSDDA